MQPPCANRIIIPQLQKLLGHSACHGGNTEVLWWGLICSDVSTMSAAKATAALNAKCVSLTSSHVVGRLWQWGSILLYDPALTLNQALLAYYCFPAAVVRAARRRVDRRWRGLPAHVHFTAMRATIMMTSYKLQCKRRLKHEPWMKQHISWQLLDWLFISKYNAIKDSREQPDQSAASSGTS